MKVNEEEEVLTIMAKEIPVILIVAVMEGIMVGEVRILMVVAAAVVEAQILMVATEEAVMVVTVPPEMTKIIRAIIRWYACLEHPAIAPDQDAARPSVSPKKAHGLVFEN